MVRNKINEVGTDLSSRSQREEVGPCTHMSDTPISKVIYTWYCSIGPLPKLECPCCLVVKSCQTPFWTHGLSMGFSRQEYSSGLPFASPGNPPNPGIKDGSPALQTDALPSEPLGKSTDIGRDSLIKEDNSRSKWFHFLENQRTRHANNT